MSNAPEIVRTHKGAYRVTVKGLHNDREYAVNYDNATDVEKALVAAAYDYQMALKRLADKLQAVKDSADYALELIGRGSDVNSLGVFQSETTIADVYAGVVYEKKCALGVLAALVDAEMDREAGVE